MGSLVESENELVSSLAKFIFDIGSKVHHQKALSYQTYDFDGFSDSAQNPFFHRLNDEDGKQAGQHWFGSVRAECANAAKHRPRSFEQPSDYQPNFGKTTDKHSLNGEPQASVENESDLCSQNDKELVATGKDNLENTQSRSSSKLLENHTASQSKAQLHSLRRTNDVGLPQTSDLASVSNENMNKGLLKRHSDNETDRSPAKVRKGEHSHSIQSLVGEDSRKCVGKKTMQQGVIADSGKEMNRSTECSLPEKEVTSNTRKELSAGAIIKKDQSKNLGQKSSDAVAQDKTSPIRSTGVEKEALEHAKYTSSSVTPKGSNAHTSHGSELEQSAEQSERVTLRASVKNACAEKESILVSTALQNSGGTHRETSKVATRAVPSAVPSAVEPVDDVEGGEPEATQAALIGVEKSLRTIAEKTMEILKTNSHKSSNVPEVSQTSTKKHTVDEVSCTNATNPPQNRNNNRGQDIEAKLKENDHLQKPLQINCQQAGFEMDGRKQNSALETAMTLLQLANSPMTSPSRSEEQKEQSTAISRNDDDPLEKEGTDSCITTQKDHNGNPRESTLSKGHDATSEKQFSPHRRDQGTTDEIQKSVVTDKSPVSHLTDKKIGSKKKASDVRIAQTNSPLSSSVFPEAQAKTTNECQLTQHDVHVEASHVEKDQTQTSKTSTDALIQNGRVPNSGISHKHSITQSSGMHLADTATNRKAMNSSSGDAVMTDDNTSVVPKKHVESNDSFPRAPSAIAPNPSPAGNEQSGLKTTVTGANPGHDLTTARLPVVGCEKPSPNLVCTEQDIPIQEAPKTECGRKLLSPSKNTSTVAHNNTNNKASEKGESEEFSILRQKEYKTFVEVLHNQDKPKDPEGLCDNKSWTLAKNTRRLADKKAFVKLHRLNRTWVQKHRNIKIPNYVWEIIQEKSLETAQSDSKLNPFVQPAKTCKIEPSASWTIALAAACHTAVTGKPPASVGASDAPVQRKSPASIGACHAPVQGKPPTLAAACLAAVLEKSASHDEQDVKPYLNTTVSMSGGESEQDLPKRAKYICVLCNKVSAAEDIIEMHTMRHHINLKPFGCPLCKEKSTTYKHIETHILEVHKDVTSYVAINSRLRRLQKQVAKDCYADASTWNRSMKHIQKRLGRFEHYLRKHIGAYLSEQGKTAPKRTGKHTGNITGTKGKAQGCDRIQVTAAKKKHKRVNDMVKKAHKGAKTTITKPHLVKKQRAESGESDKTSETKSLEEPYECILCGFHAYYEATMMQHALQHLHLLPFSCSACRNKFKTRRLTLEHIKLVHSNVPHAMLVENTPDRERQEVLMRTISITPSIPENERAAKQRNLSRVPEVSTVPDVPSGEVVTIAVPQSMTNGFSNNLETDALLSESAIAPKSPKYPALHGKTDIQAAFRENTSTSIVIE